MNQKQFEFTGKPLDYFVVLIISAITAYIPIFGWPIGFNYNNKWLADNVLINGRKVKYTAAYGETLKFLFVNVLLVIVTLGIYMIWFGIKSYKFIADHTEFVDTSAQPMAAPATPPAPMPTQMSPVQPPAAPMQPPAAPIQ